MDLLVRDVGDSLILHANELYGGEYEYTKTEEPHIVSYETKEVAAKLGGRKLKEFASVPYHTDNSEITYLVALSAMDEDYVGGGTIVEQFHPNKPINLLQGQAFFFEGGHLRHR